MNAQLELSPNLLVAFLKKPSAQFTKQDIIDFITQMDVQMVDFRYVGGDGRLKTLNFVVNNLEYLETILSCGERVDGSSLFSFIEAGSSDLYVVPRYSTAFMDPFAEIPTLTMLCSYFNKNGEHLESSPEYTLYKSHEAFKESTGMCFETMGELEFYVISEADDLYRAVDQKGYHESAPYAKFGEFRKECMHMIATCGGQIKYGHSEVGNFYLDDKIYEQNEIEFLPTDVLQAADQLVLAKWIIRTLANRYDFDVTFAPKITVGKAGSGLHIHMRMLKNGVNQMLEGGVLSQVARRAIAGMMVCAPSLSAFGNCNPTSYFRLVPHQEAPTNICWGDRNRSVLVRVPLGWTTDNDMGALANPIEKSVKRDYAGKQTVEFRCPDGSADIYQLLAGLIVACRYGLENADSLEIAEKTYVDVNIFDDANKHRVAELNQLPTSCAESSEQLSRQRDIYEAKGVFSRNAIDSVIAGLAAFNDRTMRADLANDSEKMMEIVKKYFHCG